jgi:carboxymethylenebutenolidase
MESAWAAGALRRERGSPSATFVRVSWGGSKMAVVRTEMVDLKVNGDGAAALVARLDDAAARPGVVLIQEWWGLEPHIKDLAQRLAAEGFVTAVPDLYHGKIATEPDDAQKMVMMLRANLQRAVNEVKGAIDTLAARPDVAPDNVGLIGFCVGGLLAYKTAEQSDRLAAVCPFYGSGYDPSPEEVARIQAPVLAFYGEKDSSVPPQQIEKLRGLFKQAGKQYEALVYPAGHAFVNPAHGMGDESSARDAWAKAVAFLKQHLGAGQAARS